MNVSKRQVFRSDLCVMILLEMTYVVRMHHPLSYDIHDTTNSSRELERPESYFGGDERTRETFSHVV